MTTAQNMKAKVTRTFFSYALSKGRVFSCGYCEIPAMKMKVNVLPPIETGASCFNLIRQKSSTS